MTSPPPGWGYDPTSVGQPPAYGQPPPPPPPPYGWGYDPAAMANYPPPYGGYPAPRGTNGLAIASLVCSLASPLFCYFPSIVGIVLGVIALNQLKQTGQDGRGLALAGIIVGAAVIALAVIGIVLYILFFAAYVGTSGTY